MLKFSVTQIEAYRRHLLGWLNADTLISQLKREEPPNEKMQIGTALHSLIENELFDRVAYFRDGEKITDVYESNNISFDAYSVDDFIIPTLTPVNAKEIKLCKYYDDIKLVGKADALQGLTVIDYKGTFSTFNYWNYADSIQWKAYLEIFEANKFEYLVYKLKDNNGIIEVQDFNKIELTRYPNMGQEIIELIQGLEQFVRYYQIDNYLEINE